MLHVSSPQVPVQDAVLDCLGDVLGADFVGAVEIRDGARALINGNGLIATKRHNKQGIMHLLPESHLGRPGGDLDKRSGVHKMAEEMT